MYALLLLDGHDLRVGVTHEGDDHVEHDEGEREGEADVDAPEEPLVCAVLLEVRRFEGTEGRTERREGGEGHI